MSGTLSKDRSCAPKLFENDPQGRWCVGLPNTRWIDVVLADLRALNME